MTTVSVDCPREEVPDLVRRAFERTDSIRVYYVEADRAIGKTGVRRFNWGERVVVEFTANEQGGTDLAVRVEPEVKFGFGWSATPLEPEVLGQLTAVADSAGERPDSPTTDGEVERVASLPSGTVTASVFLGVVFVYILASNTLTGFEILDLLDEPFSYGLLILWYGLVCSLALLAAILYEGTLRQRLPI